MLLAEPIQITHRLVREFERLGIQYLVGGLLASSFVASQEEMRRRGQYQISDTPNQRLFVASAEDVIVHKLYWYQLSGSVSERQWTDVLGVLQVQGEQLDYPYLEHMAHQRGVYDLLIQAMKDAEQGGI